MQNNPPSENTPEGTNTPLPPGEGDVPTSVENVGGYSEPTYKEYGQSGATPIYGAQAFGAPPLPEAAPAYNTPAPGIPIQPTPQPGYSQPVSQPGYALPTFPAGYVPPTPQGYIPSTSQPGYIQPTYQPGYVPPTPQPGYTPPSFPPGYAPPAYQPGYAPPTFPPGYIPPTSQPGYTPPFQQPQPRRRLDGWALASIALVVLVVLAAAITGITFLAHQNAPASITLPSPVACTGNSASCSTPATNGTQPAIHPTSAFQAGACPFTVGAGLTEGKQVSCGYVTVPEDRTTNNGQTVKLAIAIFRGQQYMNSVDPDPVLRLDGGPGGPSLDDWAKYMTASNYNQFIFNHDVIMFDQRGTGYSTPSLKCPELINLQYSTTDVNSQSYEQSAQTCYNRLVSQNIDLNGFNSIQNAGDVNDLIHALGYKQMTIYGVSYGTRLALTVMRLYPSVVHGIILDSTYPTNHNRNDLPSDAQRVFNVLFQGCTKDAHCNASYPNLQSVFYSLVDTLNAHPVSFTTTDPATNQQYTEPFSGDDLVSWTFSTFYATSFIPYLPEVIYQIKAHQYSLLSQIYGQLEFDSTFSDGMFYSTTCSEDWAFLTPQDITKSEQGIDPHIVKVFGQEDEQQEYAICQFWKVQPVPAIQKQPVTSNLPTLILAGEYDPITPPANGQEVEKNLSHSYFFLFPGQGHGQEYSSTCSDNIIIAFENNVNQQPNGSCISQMTEPQFQ